MAVCCLIVVPGLEAQGGRTLEVGLGPSVSLITGGDQFDFPPGGFEPLAVGIEGAVRWYVGDRLGLGVTVQRVAFSFTEPDPGYSGIDELPGSRRFIIAALEVRARLRLDTAAAVQPFLSGALGYARERFTRTFVCTNDAQTEFWSCQEGSDDAGGALSATAGVECSLGPRVRAETALSVTSVVMGSSGGMGIGLRDIGEWLGLRLGVTATLW